MVTGWEMDVHGNVYNKILIGLLTKGLGTQNVAMYSNSDIPSVFPFVFVDLIDSSEQGQDLEGKTVNGGLFSFQIDVYHNSSPQEAKKLMMEVVQIMKSMRFDIVGIPLFNRQDGIHRCTARFRRMIGADDNYMSM